MKNKGQVITTWGILLSIVSLLGLETWTLLNHDDNDTISEIVQTASHKWIFIPFLVGFLMGHWFWPLDIRRNYARK